jgi:hypothetical protein
MVRKMKRKMQSWLSARLPSKQRAAIDQFADENEVSMAKRSGYCWLQALKHRNVKKI